MVEVALHLFISLYHIYIWFIPPERAALAGVTGTSHVRGGCWQLEAVRDRVPGSEMG